MRLIKRVLPLTAALTLAGCMISQPANVAGVDRVIGDALPGAKGETLRDQDRIDDTIARGCAGGVYSIELCDIHTKASAERRLELRSGG